MRFNSLKALAEQKGLTLMKYRSGGYSLDNGSKALYSSGYGSTLARISEKLDKLESVKAGDRSPVNGYMYLTDGYILKDL